MRAPEDWALAGTTDGSEHFGAHARSAARQAIPRPAHARVIEGPYPELAAAGPRASPGVGELRAAFSRAAVDLDADDGGGEFSGAAVLLALFPGEPSDMFGEPSDKVEEQLKSPVGASRAGLRALLIRRADHLRANPGEVALPGGKAEPDETALTAALREAAEEVALAPSQVEVLGRLQTVRRLSSTQGIVPFVGLVMGRPRLVASPSEVGAVLVVEISRLLAQGCYWREEWSRIGEVEWTMHFFDLGGDVVWGATARILYEFLVVLLAPGAS